MDPISHKKDYKVKKKLLGQSYLYGLLITWYFGTMIKYFNVSLWKHLTLNNKRNNLIIFF